MLNAVTLSVVVLSVVLIGEKKSKNRKKNLFMGFCKYQTKEARVVAIVQNLSTLSLTVNQNKLDSFVRNFFFHLDEEATSLPTLLGTVIWSTRAGSSIIRLVQKNVAGEKHSSLLCDAISGEDKKIFMTLTLGEW